MRRLTPTHQLQSKMKSRNKTVKGMMSKLVLYMTNSPLSSSDALISQKRKALQHGCVFSLLRSMAFTYTKGNSEMLYVCGTGGK